MKKFLLFICLLYALAMPAWSQTPTALDTIWTVKNNFSSRIQSVIFSTDGNKIYHTADNKVQIRNTSDGSLIKTIQCSENEDLIQVAATTDDKYIVTSSDTGLVKLWDVQTGQMIFEYKVDTIYQLISKKNYRMIDKKFTLTKDSKYIIVPMLRLERNNPNDPTDWRDYPCYYVYELLTGRVVQTVYDYKYNIHAFCTSNSSGLIAAGSSRLQTMDPVTFELSDTLVGETNIGGNVMTDINFSPDGKLISTAGRDGFIKIWDVDNRKLITSFLHKNKLDLVHAVKFSNNGQYLYSTGKLMIKKWDVINNYSLDFIKDSLRYFGDLCGIGEIDYHPSLNYLVANSCGIVLFNTDSFTGTHIEIPAQPSLIVPNPIIDTLIITNALDSIKQLFVADLSGRLVKWINLTSINQTGNSISVNLSDISSGTYLLVISNGISTQSIKFIKE